MPYVSGPGPVHPLGDNSSEPPLPANIQQDIVQYLTLLKLPAAVQDLLPNHDQAMSSTLQSIETWSEQNNSPIAEILLRTQGGTINANVLESTFGIDQKTAQADFVTAYRSQVIEPLLTPILNQTKFSDSNDNSAYANYLSGNNPTAFKGYLSQLYNLLSAGSESPIETAFASIIESSNSILGSAPSEVTFIANRSGVVHNIATYLYTLMNQTAPALPSNQDGNLKPTDDLVASINQAISMLSSQEPLCSQLLGTTPIENNPMFTLGNLVQLDFATFQKDFFSYYSTSINPPNPQVLSGAGLPDFLQKDFNKLFNDMQTLNSYTMFFGASIGSTSKQFSQSISEISSVYLYSLGQMDYLIQNYDPEYNNGNYFTQFAEALFDNMGDPNNPDANPEGHSASPNAIKTPIATFVENWKYAQASSMPPGSDPV